MAIASWIAGDYDEAETQWNRVDDVRYRDLAWLRDYRRWAKPWLDGAEDLALIRETRATPTETGGIIK